MCSSIIVFVREGERETDTDRKTETDRETEKGEEFTGGRLSIYTFLLRVHSNDSLKLLKQLFLFSAFFFLEKKRK